MRIYNLDSIAPSLLACPLLLHHGMHAGSDAAALQALRDSFVSQVLAPTPPPPPPSLTPIGGLSGVVTEPSSTAHHRAGAVASLLEAKIAGHPRLELVQPPSSALPGQQSAAAPPDDAGLLAAANTTAGRGGGGGGGGRGAGVWFTAVSVPLHGIAGEDVNAEVSLLDTYKWGEAANTRHLLVVVLTA